MSTYMIDKFLRKVQMDRAAFAAFYSDRQGFVDRWTTDQIRLPITLGEGRLTEAEREAIVTLDIAALYEAGAHPYMLWHFAADVLTALGQDRSDVIRQYKASVSNLGHPSFNT